MWCGTGHKELNDVPVLNSEGPDVLLGFGGAFFLTIP